MTLNEIKDRIYEAEGLLELLRLRQEKLDELRPLILTRLEEAKNALMEFGCEETTVTEPDTREDTPSADHATSENTTNEYVTNESTTAVGTATSDDTTEELDAPIYAVEGNEIESPKHDVRLDKKAAKPAFCLNDRFRFRRSIFGGSDAEFNAAMDNLATLDSYEEAEELFYGEMELNPETPDVADFMNIIKEYFGR